MKTKMLLCLASISIVALGGCAGTSGSKPTSTTSKDSKAITVKDIVARYSKAIYGSGGTRKHQSTTMKGTLAVEQFSIEGPLVAYTMAPDSSVSNIELMGMKLSNGCHKGACWSQQPGAGIATVSGDAAAMQLQQADYTQWQHIERYYSSMEIVHPADGKESSNYKIKAVKKNGDTDYYEFAKDSGLLVAAVFEGQTAQGHMQIGAQFNNYKDFDGVMICTEIVQTTSQATIKMTLNEISFAPLTEDTFARPQ